jgi:NAD(P)-dependent dehydrogenase (short-subunit alcohol dehydrogenase family)
MTKALDGKTAIVTGGASGIGTAIARRVAHAVCRVAIADRDAEACGEVAEEIGGEAIPTDVKSEAAVEALLGGQPVPPHRLDILLRHTQAFVVHPSAVVLGRGVVAANVGAGALLPALPICRYEGREENHSK